MQSFGKLINDTARVVLSEFRVEKRGNSDVVFSLY